MEFIGCSETSVANYNPILRIIPEEKRLQLREILLYFSKINTQNLEMSSTSVC
jgi:hypothetical protein